MSEELTIFGLRPVMQAIEAEKQIEKVFIRKGADSPLVQQLRDLCKQNNVSTSDVPVEKLNRLTRGNHQGIVAQMSPIEYVELSDVVDALESEGKVPLILLLDGVTDVRNFGAIARSAECAGAHAICVSLKRSAPVNSESIRSSAGALNIIPVSRVGSIRNTIKMLSSRGMQIVAATEKSDKPLYNANFTKPTVIIMGAEDTGISKEVLKLCDEQLSIPIMGQVQSLNVSVAAGVLLYEVVRQRR